MQTFGFLKIQQIPWRFIEIVCINNLFLFIAK